METCDQKNESGCGCGLVGDSEDCSLALKGDEALFFSTLMERFKLFQKKNRDYGSSFRVEGIVGLLIREGDKFSRLKKVSSNGMKMEVQNEGLKELFEDIANYCDIGLMLLREKEVKK